MVDTAPRARLRRRLRPATKIAILFVVAVAVIYFGYRAWSSYMVSTFTFTPIAPKRVNLVAVDPGAGYRILVANGVAQLAEVSGGGLDAPDLETVQESDVVSSKKVPLKEMLRSLQGEGAGLGAFIMRINDIKPDDIPAEAPVWKAADIRKAIEGDAELKTKLERDLNIGLDGTPPNRVLASACINGIVIETPVPIDVGGKEVVGNVLQPYRPSFIERVEKVLAERFDADAARPGVYRETLAQLGQKEDVAKSLLDRIGEQRRAAYSSPTQLLETSAYAPAH